MKLLQQLTSLLFTLAFSAAVLVAAWYLVTSRPTPKVADKPTPPAKVNKVVKEEELNTLVLTPEAEKRIAIQLGKATTKSVGRVRTYGGDVTIPPGKTVLVAAPVSGMLKSKNGMPRPGQAVKKGQVLLHLLPLLTPEGRTTIASALVEADGQVKQMTTQLEAAKIALNRARRLLREEAGSQRNLDDAQAAYDIASKALEAATTRRKLLQQVSGETENGTASPLPIPSPEDGILRSVSALPDQTVPSGGALFEIVNLSTVWVRVPLPVGDLDEIRRDADAIITRLSTPNSTEPSRTARPIAAPPSANALAGTIDLFYEFSNTDSKIVPGQRLGITLPMNDHRTSPTVPRGAVVYDVHGGSWVYEQTAPKTFVRRRVVVRYILDDDAVLESWRGGQAVVIVGSQELFGAETGFSK